MVCCSKRMALAPRVLVNSTHVKIPSSAALVASFGPVQAVRGARREDGSTGSEPDSFPTTLDRTSYGT